MNRRDDERENIDLYIIIRRSGERETKRKKTIKNIQMRSVCAVRPQGDEHIEGHFGINEMCAD